MMQGQSLTRFATAPFTGGSLLFGTLQCFQPLPIKGKWHSILLIDLKPPLCKGRWRTAGAAEGLYKQYCRFEDNT